MGVNFKVAMILEAVNNMNPGIRRGMDSVNRLRNRITSTARETSRINPVRGWEDKINRVAQAAKKIGKELKKSGKSISLSGERMQNSGFRNVAEGAGLFAPVMDMANKAAALQMKMTSMRMSGISTEGTQELIQRADEYTERTLFSKTEIADMFLSMRQSGMKEQNILRGSEPMVMLAELENIRRGTVGTETAKVLAQMAERGGILQDPNIERWNEFLELVNKVTTVTTAGIPELHESSKYLEPTARMANWSEQDMMWSQGVAARLGLEGSVAGTDLKNMIERVNPYKWYKEGRPDQHLDAMDRLGWLQNVQSHENKTGRIAYDGIGGSVMIREDGSTVDLRTMFGHLAKSWEKYKNLPQGRAKFAADVFKVFGAEGDKVANLVSQNYEIIQQMMQDAGNVKPIHGQIDEYSKQYMQNYKAFKSSTENLEIDAGNTFLPAGTDLIQNTLRPWIQSIREFTQAHPGFVGAVAKGVAVIGGLKIGSGILKLLGGTILSTLGGFASGAGKTIGWMRKLFKGAVNLKTGFDLIRATGASFGKSIVKGAELAWPWLEKLNGWVGKFTPFFLRNAARIAAGWLIAMGPPGWIILGVTALIIAAVLAWKNNFMGFRDKCAEVWNWLKDYTEYIFPSLYKSIGEFIESAKKYWGDLKTWIGEIWDGTVKWTSEALETMCGWVRKACDYMGIDFDNLASKIENLIQKLWVVQAYKGIKNHFERFDDWRNWKGRVEQRDYLKDTGDTFEPTPFFGGSPKKESALDLGPKPSTPIQFPRFQNNTPYQSQPYIVQPLMYGGGQAQGFKQTNNIRVDSHKEAAEFVRQAVPDKYKSSGNNPRNHVGISYGAVGELV